MSQSDDRNPQRSNESGRVLPFVPLTVACFNERHHKCSGVSPAENPPGDWPAPECPCPCHYEREERLRDHRADSDPKNPKLLP